MQKIHKQTWEATCPVCMQGNDCQAAEGKPVESCWCFSTQVDQSVLDALPPEDRGTRCLCSKCICGDSGKRTGQASL